MILKRSELAGLCLFGMIFLSTIFSKNSFVHWPLAYPLSGVAALIASALLICDLRTSAKIQVSVLFGIGSLLLMVAHGRGVSFSIVDAISRNALLLTMIMSVGFLKLILDLDKSDIRLLRGKKAHLQTLLGLGLFGSVINISAPILMCDRLAKEKPLDALTLRSFSQVFCACSCWSPYFGGTALVLTYVQGVSLVFIMLTGLPLLIFTILFTHFLTLSLNREHTLRFAGYPMSIRQLWLPVSLSLLVVGIQKLMPGMSILAVISVSSLLLTFGVVGTTLGFQGAKGIFVNYVKNGLPQRSNELLLFVSAGVLATGISAFLSSTDFDLNLQAYTWQTASLTLALMILTAAAGIHPVIQISVLTPFLLPLSPAPDLLAMTFLFAWALGNAASPLSGTHLMMQGRYDVSAWKLAVQNWPYVFVTYFVAITLLALLNLFTQS